MSRPTVAIFVNTSWNIYNFRMNIVQALVKEGYEVLCMAPRDEYSERLLGEQVRYVEVKMENRGVNPWKDFLLWWEVWKMFRRYRPEVVLQFTIKPNIYGSLAARLCGIPVVNNVSGLGTVFLHDNWSSKIAKALYRLAFRSPFRIFFQNSDDLELFVKNKLVRSSQTALLPGSGVDLRRFSVEPFRRHSPFVFLMVARLITDKGLFEYLEAARQLNAQFGHLIECRLQGSPADSALAGLTAVQLKEVLSQYPVVYLPFSDRIEEQVKGADVVVLPSYREGIARVLLESAAMGKPLVATDVPGCREVVRPGYNGWLCRAKDAASLCQAMEKAWQADEQTLQRYGSNSRLLVEQEFSIEQVNALYLQAVQEALQQKKQT